mmetsp:Transcript_16757/g.25129  ORF Transcript_16757/g.25129 Transcript_16757/m.25129 type:complete len:241 (+) Transcript_16757:204-926(+)
MTKDAAATVNRKRPAVQELQSNHEFHHGGTEDIGLDGITAIEFSGHHHDDDDKYPPDNGDYEHDDVLQNHTDDEDNRDQSDSNEHCIGGPNEHETSSPSETNQLAHSQSHSQDDMDDDPEWDSIAQNGPARDDVPLFLAARERRIEAEQRFERSLDTAHSNLKDLIDGLVDVAANVINDRRMRLDSLEAEIKQEFVDNENARADMSKKLEEFAASAQAQFQQLMNRLANARGGIGRNASA